MNNNDLNINRNNIIPEHNAQNLKNEEDKHSAPIKTSNVSELLFPSATPSLLQENLQTLSTTHQNFKFVKALINLKNNIVKVLFPNFKLRLDSLNLTKQKIENVKYGLEKLKKHPELNSSETNLSILTNELEAFELILKQQKSELYKGSKVIQTKNKSVNTNIQENDKESNIRQLKEKSIKIEDNKYYYTNDIVLSEEDINSIASQSATIKKTDEIKTIYLNSEQYIVKFKNKQKSSKISVYKKGHQIGQGNYGTISKVIKIGKKEKIAALKENHSCNQDTIAEASNLILLRMSLKDQKKGVSPQEFIQTPEGKKAAKQTIKGIMDAPYVVIKGNKNPLGEQPCGYIAKLYDGNAEKLFPAKNKQATPNDHKIFLRGMLDVLDGLEYMHNNDMVHGDFKLDNVLCKKNEKNVNFYLADFGGCKTKNQLQQKSPVWENLIDLPVSHLHYILLDLFEKLPIKKQIRKGFEILKNADICAFVKAIGEYIAFCNNKDLKKEIPQEFYLICLPEDNFLDFQKCVLNKVFTFKKVRSILENLIEKLDK